LPTAVLVFTAAPARAWVVSTELAIQLAGPPCHGPNPKPDSGALELISAERSARPAHAPVF
jgi:hypothetical protein